jgi:phospholipase/carboxylesterase
MLAQVDAITKDTGKAPSWGVIWLHGLGADGNDFVPIVDELCQPVSVALANEPKGNLVALANESTNNVAAKPWPAIRFVFPHAPVRAVTINGGARMRAWYDIKSLDRTALGEAPGIREAIAMIDRLMTQFSQAGIPSERVLIAGFSQGGALALCASLRQSRKLGGVIALSSYLPLMESLDAERAPANQDTPIFMAHGSFDPVVPLQLGTMSLEALRSRKYTLEWQTYPMQHSVCAEEVADVRQWMAARFIS